MTASSRPSQEAARPARGRKVGLAGSLLDMRLTSRSQRVPVDGPQPVVSSGGTSWASGLALAAPGKTVSRKGLTEPDASVGLPSAQDRDERPEIPPCLALKIFFS